MLARIEAHPFLQAAFLSSDGRRLLVQGVPGAERAELFAACAHVLSESKLRPEPRPDAEARAAWSARGDPSAWLGRDELWRLSWREAETFTDRLLVELERRFGTSTRSLRGTLVESFFESVRPGDGSGPTPRRWRKGAPLPERLDALLAEAAELFLAPQLEELSVLLRDHEAVRKITRSPSAQEISMTARETPWSLTFHDGSGNGSRLWQDGPGDAQLEYSPVTPQRSSSGTYSGGEPWRGAVAVTQVAAVWKEAERLAADPSLRAEGRAMGTGRLRLETPSGERTLTLERGSFDALVELLSRIRED